MEYCYKITAYTERTAKEQYWVAEAAEFPNTIGVGETCAEAVTDLMAALHSLITFLQENGDPIPPPYIHEEPDTTWQRLAKKRRVARRGIQPGAAALYTGSGEAAPRRAQAQR